VSKHETTNFGGLIFGPMVGFSSVKLHYHPAQLQVGYQEQSPSCHV
jgi:hypothetical protein